MYCQYFQDRWCGPCKLLSPRLEKVLSNHANDVKLAKVDVDDFEDLAIKFRVNILYAIHFSIYTKQKLLIVDSSAPI